MADIVEVEANLETYKEQLSHVSNALEVKNDDSELLSLKNDLLEIIKITENELLNLKKTQLLSKLDDEQDANTSDDEEDDIDLFIGMKCSIPYTTKWGSFQQQNCIILSIEFSNDSETKIKVLFLTPSSKEMLPCKQYLNSECKFENCKYSHGCEVDISVLSEYQEPNFDKFEKGKRCLCKNENELWVPGTVTSVNIDEIYVKLDGSNSEISFSYENVFPLQSCYDDDSNSDNELLNECSSSDLTASSYPQKFSQNCNFGGWEKHTNSFGSKMLFKMGYKPGNGLGPRGDGILEPVEADVIPMGVSLDTVKELREKCLIRTVYKLNGILKKKSDHKANLCQKKTQNENSMFYMIDKMLKNHASKRKDMCSINSKNKKPINKVTDKTVRMKSITIENDIIRCKQRLSVLKQSISRNKNDDLHCNRLQHKIEEENVKLDTLLRKQDSVENEIQFRNGNKKLKIF